MNLNFEHEKKKERQREIIREIIKWAIKIVITIGVAFLVVHFCLLRTIMTGSSMDNTLVNGQEVIINKGAYLVFSPSRNDVIATYITDEEKVDDDYVITIRRVVGLPGEKIQVKKGYIYINGVEFQEKYKMPVMISGGIADKEVTLGKDEYFVLGDNRNDSEDSRFRSFGNVKKRNILGRVIFKMDPFSMIGGPTLEEKTED